MYVLIILIYTNSIYTNKKIKHLKEQSNRTKLILNNF